MTDEEFRAWLYRPLTLPELLAIELRESCRQWGFCEATQVADQLQAEVEHQQAWDQVAAGVVLRDLAVTPPNPYPEGRSYPERRAAQAGCRQRA